jgi:N-methylhydantoinase A/oxoprolinase/acetone carboxylase beta subunit
MGMLINIDNGGTLTDIFATDGDQVYRTKTLTTPFDLSRCIFEGLTKVSRLIYGEADLRTLLSTTDHIRYSTTQGTNALVERKGPRLGLILSGELVAAALQREPEGAELFAALVGSRVVGLDLDAQAAELERAALKAINALSAAGVNRVVVAHGGPDRNGRESHLKNIFLQKFPQHLLGAIPILYSHEVVEDDDDIRRTWTALLNAFLHPAMEAFLYNTEHRLRTHKARNPLLIFRNDGHSARVAKTIAIKTYSSGPRGGMEGARALARHHGFEHLVSMDIGGTTTDIAEVSNGAVQIERRGRVEAIEVSFPLCHVVSTGVGGSSIITLVDGEFRVGPQSVGSAPGPACFGLGGTVPTVTDAILLTGLLDSASYFGGELTIDVERARKVIAEQIAAPLGLSPQQAAQAMEHAWVAKVATEITQSAAIVDNTTLAAFGGAGPMLACEVAAAVGISRIVIPGLAAVFSAYGLGFSDIAHQYEAPLRSADTLDECLGLLLQRARRGMRAEGFDLDQCDITETLQITSAGRDETVTLNGKCLPDDLPAGAQLSVSLQVSKSIRQPQYRGGFGRETQAAIANGGRDLLVGAEKVEVPVYRVEDQPAGSSATGPAVLEEAFFTCRVEPGWSFEVNDNRDILLQRA